LNETLEKMKVGNDNKHTAMIEAKKQRQKDKQDRINKLRQQEGLLDKKTRTQVNVLKGTLNSLQFANNTFIERDAEGILVRMVFP
jgi:hypothetical protein